jgi:hypothetical protein
MMRPSDGDESLENRPERHFDAANRRHLGSYGGADQQKVDATVQSYPEIYQARKLGMNVLADIGDFGFYTNTSNIVTRSYLQQNRACDQGLHQGPDRGIHYVKTNKEGSLKVLRKYLQITDAEAVEGTYEFFAKRLSRSPRTELEGIKNILTSIGAGQKSPAEFVDMSVIDEIEKKVSSRSCTGVEGSERLMAATNLPTLLFKGGGFPPFAKGDRGAFCYAEFRPAFFGRLSMSAKLRLSVACGDYEIIRALKEEPCRRTASSSSS